MLDECIVSITPTSTAIIDYLNVTRLNPIAGENTDLLIEFQLPYDISSGLVLNLDFANPSGSTTYLYATGYSSEDDLDLYYSDSKATIKG